MHSYIFEGEFRNAYCVSLNNEYVLRRFHLIENKLFVACIVTIILANVEFVYA